MKILIVGCGYVGLEFATQWNAKYGKRAEHSLFALTRSETRGESLAACDIAPIVGDWLDGDLLALPEVDGVLVAVPHRPVEPHGLQTHIVGLNHILERLHQPSLRVVYLSTTGVYSQREPHRVDESTPVSPTRPGPQVAVLAEEWLRAQRELGRLDSLTICRLAGIYGRERIPLIRSVLAGEPLAVSRDGHLNLIHVVDIGQMLLQLFEQSPPQTMYVVSDGQPVLRDEFYRELARLCGTAEPIFVQPDEGDPKLRRATDKRVDPRRLFSDVPMSLRFPDYRAGLADAVEAELKARSSGLPRDST